MVLGLVTRADFPGGELEYTVLTTLWELGTASARDLYDRVGEPRGLVYTTIAKILDRLHEKRFVTRARRGKSFMYKAAVPRPRVDQARAQAMVQRLLGDSPRPALAALVDAVESIDPSLLDELEKTIAARRRQRDGS